MCKTRSTINAIKRWANDAQKERYFPQAWRKDTISAPTRLSEPGSGSDAFALQVAGRTDAG